MAEYRVTWTIDVDADSPQEAAREAFAMMRDDGTGTTATVRRKIPLTGTSEPYTLGDPVMVDVSEEG